MISDPIGTGLIMHSSHFFFSTCWLPVLFLAAITVHRKKVSDGDGTGISLTFFAVYRIQYLLLPLHFSYISVTARPLCSRFCMYVIMFKRVLFFFIQYLFLLLLFEFSCSLLYPLLTGCDYQSLIPLASYLSPFSFPPVISTLYFALSFLCSHCCHRCHSGRYLGHQIYGRHLSLVWRCNCCKK